MDVVEWLTGQQVWEILHHKMWNGNAPYSGVSLEEAEIVLNLLEGAGIKFYKTIEADIYGTKT